VSSQACAASHCALSCPIWLVRHAPTAWTGQRWCGRSDPELTPAGHLGADRLGREIAADLAAGVVILSSPLRRAVETADGIARASGVGAMSVEPDLVEVDFGAADGLTWDELVAGFPSLGATILARAEVDWPAGESAATVDKRARRAAESVLAAARSCPVVVVSHGGLLPALARHLGFETASGSFEPASALFVRPVPAG